MPQKEKEWSEVEKFNAVPLLPSKSNSNQEVWIMELAPGIDFESLNNLKITLPDISILFKKIQKFEIKFRTFLKKFFHFFSIGTRPLDLRRTASFTS